MIRFRPMRIALRLALLAIALLPAPVLAGANKDRGQDEVGPGPDEGPSYFGVVLDTAGKPVDDARVTATSRDGLAMTTRSNAAGTYSLPGFNKRINADEVKIACAKPGYRQVRVVRRPVQGGRPLRAVETECRLQKS
jgi:Carboxypeptidase regulatory-like domain